MFECIVYTWEECARVFVSSSSFNVEPIIPNFSSHRDLFIFSLLLFFLALHSLLHVSFSSGYDYTVSRFVFLLPGIELNKKKGGTN